MAEIKIKADSNGGTVSLKGPATTTGNAAIQLTLPVDDGTANQTLTTNGSGVLSWAAPVIADDSIVEAKLDIHAAPSGTDKFLGYTSNGMEWAVPSGGIAATHDGVVKVWCNFNGTGTIAIRDHYNVSSITDNHTGTYTVSFDTDFASVNFVAVISGGHSGNSSAPRGFETVSNMQVGSVKMDFRDDTGNEADPQVVSVICIGDQ